jgi:phosphotransferase system HPr-like phosphotransfer protein
VGSVKEKKLEQFKRKMLRVKKINPLETYNLQMKQVRKKYLLEFKDNLEKNVSTQNVQKVQKLKVREEQEIKVVKDLDPNKEIKLFQMTRQELKNYYMDRSFERFNRILNRKKEENQRKLNAFLKLYHDSKDFVTYQNLEEKLDSVVCSSNLNKFLSIQEMITLRVQKGDDIHLKKKCDQRKEALQDVLSGTIGGNIGKEEVEKIIKEFNETGFIEVKAKVNGQKDNLEAVLDKMCL